MHVRAHAFRTNAQLSPRDLANETDVLQQEWRRHRKHKWKPNGVRRRLRGLIWQVTEGWRGGRRVEGETKKEPWGLKEMKRGERSERGE